MKMNGWPLGLIMMVFTIVSCGPSSQNEAETEDTAPAEETNAEASSEFEDITAPENWRNFKADSISSQWELQDGVLTLAGEGGGDIVTKKQYDNFELEMEWKISEGGNSGLMFHVVEADSLGATYHSGPEYQLLDNERHPDAKIETHRTGDNYDLQKSTVETVKPAGEWNQTRLVVNEGKVEHYLNGEKVVEYELWTPEWEEAVANSKFAEFPAYGQAKEGHIALQDHGDEVSFRNIRVREL
ncbi:3-keto-disaccharide hydrolase [Catalinimonas niigatensis]|uniref:3-keto-disaccharide hydrolase n=1 Tax=Catalinimonas niigatensis TaxID=1397264 RepID=UPI002665F470|nr:DUF1080 domain-containing protein [Catalinimonas niigatensis]WPP48109.1 DUF1080 domain-containing protein [Catalinimonas niigatensis]